MYEYDRHREIINILSETKSASVHSLAQKLYVSEATVRRDLTELEKQGQVRRVFGGVILLENDHITTAFHGRSTREAELDKIAQRAVEYIHNGDVLMMDASSSASAILRYLKRFKGLTLITNSAITIGGLQDINAQVFVTGGYMPKNSQGFVGAYAENMVRNFNADLFFFSCAGLSMDGRVTDISSDENSIRKVMFQQARRRILLCDRSKFGKSLCFNTCSLDQVDALISDQPFTGKGAEKQHLRAGREGD